MRYDRVQSILEAERAFKDRLGPKDTEVTKRNGQPQRFAKSVIEVTRRLHANGIDAHTADKSLVVRLADEVLSSFKTNAVPKKPAEVKPPDAKLAEPRPVKAKAKPEKPKRAKPETPAPAPAPTVDLAPAPVSPAAPVAPAPAPPLTTTYIFLSVLTLLHSAYNLLQMFDREPGAEKRQEKLAEQMEEMYKLRDVPVPIPVNTIPTSLKNGQLPAAKS